MLDPVNPDYTNTPVSSQRPRFGYTAADPFAPPCLTIVTPFYNTDALFHETARSVLPQSLQQWEWLIVNDGSTDLESLAILESYRHGDPRIRVIDHEINRGLSAARNTGFRAARAPYVVQLDSDDLLEPTTVEKWFWCLESYPEFAFVKGSSISFGAQEYLWQKGFHNGSAFLEANLVNPTSAIRKAVHQAVGGYDEADRSGLMDWDFWLRCASFGYWGGTVPEYLDWYRRRPTHGDRWPDWDNGGRQRIYWAKLRQKYARLWNGAFPQIHLRRDMPHDFVPDVLPCENRLDKGQPRLLLLVPWLTSRGANIFNLDMLGQLSRRGWEITVVTTLKADYSWLSRFADHTPDVFSLPHFLRLVDYPRFLRYLLQSRQMDVVMVSDSERASFLLPYLRAHYPEAAFIGFCQGEADNREQGRYSHLLMEYQELLDLNLVSSEYLKGRLVQHDANPWRIRVCGHYDPERMAEQIVLSLQEGIHLHTVQPRPTPSLSLGRICAIQGVEYIRLAETDDGQRREYEGTALSPHLLDPHSESWRTLAYFALRRLALPYYRAALSRNIKWFLPLKDRLKRVLLRKI